MYNFSYDTFFLSNEKEMLKNEAQTEALLLKVSNLLFPGAEFTVSHQLFFFHFSYLFRSWSTTLKNVYTSYSALSFC